MTKRPAEAISNTSPLIYLDKINRLDLLGKVFAATYLTPAVLDEIAAGPGGAGLVGRIKGSRSFRLLDSVAPPRELLEWDLGRGETSIIAWARQHPDLCLIIDDRAAYQCASLYGLTITGTVGVLLRAKERGFLGNISGPLHDLINAGCWISENVKMAALNSAGESG